MPVGVLALVWNGCTSIEGVSESAPQFVGVDSTSASLRTGARNVAFGTQDRASIGAASALPHEVGIDRNCFCGSLSGSQGGRPAP